MGIAALSVGATVLDTRIDGGGVRRECAGTTVSPTTLTSAQISTFERCVMVPA